MRIPIPDLPNTSEWTAIRLYAHDIIKEIWLNNKKEDDSGIVVIMKPGTSAALPCVYYLICIHEKDFTLLYENRENTYDNKIFGYFDTLEECGKYILEHINENT